MGGAIAAAVRDGDAAGRFGGDEFVVLLAEITDDELANVAERIRATVAALCIDAAGRPAITGPSVSIGIASSASDATSVQDLLNAADQAVYAAKNGSSAIGRNPSQAGDRRHIEV